MCTYCSRCYPNQAKFDEHRHLHNSPESDERRDYLCIICKRFYSTMDNLRDHRRKVHGPREICSICHQSFAHSYLRKHQQIVHGVEKPLEMTSKESKNLRFKSKVGGEVTPKSPTLFGNDEVKPSKKKNVKKKEENRPYCSICQREMYNEYALQRHNLLFHNSSGKKIAKKFMI